MTREEARLAQHEQSIRKALKTQHDRLNRLHAQQRAAEKKQRDRRRYRLGSLAEQAGLAGWDDGTLEKLFLLLSTLRDTPNPVGALGGLLADAGGPLPGAPGACTPPAGSFPPSL